MREILLLVTHEGHSMYLFFNNEEHQKQDSHRTKYLSNSSFLKAVSKRLTHITLQYRAVMIIVVECLALELLQLCFLCRISFCAYDAYHTLHELSRVWYLRGHLRQPPSLMPPGHTSSTFAFTCYFSIGILSPNFPSDLGRG